MKKTTVQLHGATSRGKPWLATPSEGDVVTRYKTNYKTKKHNKAAHRIKPKAHKRK